MRKGLLRQGDKNLAYSILNGVTPFSKGKVTNFHNLTRKGASLELNALFLNTAHHFIVKLSKYKRGTVVVR